jgi:hypothetical protein
MFQEIQIKHHLKKRDLKKFPKAQKFSQPNVTSVHLSKRKLKKSQNKNIYLKLQANPLKLS